MTTIDFAEQRKIRSEEYLRSLSVPINPHLPQVEDESNAEFRKAKEVAQRSLVLYGVVLVAHGFDKDQIISWIKEENLWPLASPKEKVFLESDNPSQQDIVTASWRAEALWVMLWALGRISELGAPALQCDAETIQQILEEESYREFVKHCVLRSPSEILDETDLIYRMHWAVVDSRLPDQPTPGAFDPAIVWERHYALNWLTCYADGWDDVTTDT